MNNSLCSPPLCILSLFQVFDARLNHQHMVIKDLDIYDRVGYGVAHDEYIPFSLRNGQLKFGPHSSPFSGTLYVEFVKVSCPLSMGT